MVYSFEMISPVKKFFIMFFWMGITAFSVIIADLYLPIPDEVSGIMYFIGLGVTASAVLNYYKK